MGTTDFAVGWWRRHFDGVLLERDRVVAEGTVNLGCAVGGVGAEPELDGLAQGVVGLGCDGLLREQDALELCLIGHGDAGAVVVAVEAQAVVGRQLQGKQEQYQGCYTKSKCVLTTITDWLVVQRHKKITKPDLSSSKSAKMAI